MSTFKPFYIVPLLDGDGKSMLTKKGYASLTYLKAEKRSLVNWGFDLYDDCYYLFSGLSGQHFASYQQKIYAAINDSASGHLKTELDLLQLDFKKAKVFYAYKTHNQLLQDNDLWQSWDNSIIESSARLKLRLLNANWKTHAKLSHFTSEALLFAVDILTELEWHLRTAIAEFAAEGDRLPGSCYTAYQDYLQECAKNIEQEKINICWAMFARLELASQTGHVAYDDVTFQLEAELKSLGITLQTAAKITEARHGLNGNIINAFVRYINDQGNIDVKAKLTTLNWFTDANSLSLLPVRGVEKNYLVPKQLQLFIPAKAKKPAWLFSGHHKRYTFFQDQTEYLIESAALAKHDITLTQTNNPWQDPIWQMLKQQELLVEEKLKAAQGQIATGFRSLLHKQTNQFLAAWQMQLRNQQRIIISKQLDFLQQLVPKIQPLNHVIDEPLFAEQAVLAIYRMLDEVDAQLEKIGVLTTEHNRFQQLDKQLDVLLSKDLKIRIDHQARAQVEQSLTTLLDNRLDDESAYQAIFAYYKKLEIAEQIAFIHQHETYLTSLGDKLQTILLPFPEYMAFSKNQAEILVHAYQCAHILHEFDYNDKNNTLKNCVNALLVRYQNYIETEAIASLRLQVAHLSQLEDTLKQIMSAEQYKQWVLLKLRCEVRLNQTEVRDPKLLKLIRESEQKLEQSTVSNTENIQSKLVGLIQENEASQERAQAEQEAILLALQNLRSRQQKIIGITKTKASDATNSVNKAATMAKPAVITTSKLVFK